MGCGLKVYVKDGEVVKVEGDENHPVTKGRLCVRCLTIGHSIIDLMKRGGPSSSTSTPCITWTIIG